MSVDPYPVGSTTSGGDAVHILPKQYREVQTKKNFESCYVQQTDSSVKKLHTLNLIENVKSNLTATRNEYLMLFSCATALLDKQERSLSVRESSDMTLNIFILMRAQQATPLAAYLQIIDFSLTALSQCRHCGDTIDAKTHVGVSWLVATRKIARHVDEITLVEKMSICVTLF